MAKGMNAAVMATAASAFWIGVSASISGISEYVFSPAL